MRIIILQHNHVRHNQQNENAIWNKAAIVMLILMKLQPPCAFYYF